MSNPLLNMQGLPAFSQIKTEHIEPAIDEILSINRKQIKQLLDDNSSPSWESVIEPIEILEDRLSRAWSPVSHMNSVVNSDELREAYNACLPKLSEYGTEMGQNEQLYQAYKTVSENDSSLNEVQKKVLDNALRDFKLSNEEHFILQLICLVFVGVAFLLLGSNVMIESAHNCEFVLNSSSEVDLGGGNKTILYNYVHDNHCTPSLGVGVAFQYLTRGFFILLFLYLTTFIFYRQFVDKMVKFLSRK